MKADRVMVVDVECTCWERGFEPPNEKQEIIEIGFCEVNMRSLDIGKPTSIYVKPERSSVSKYCSDLTGITQEFLNDNGAPFKDAVEFLKKNHDSHLSVMASWGAFDREMFVRCANMYGTVYPFMASHTDIKFLFSLWQGSVKMYGLSKALERLGVEFDGTKHSGRDDAYNAAKVLVAMSRSFKFARDFMYGAGTSYLLLDAVNKRRDANE